jgi:hypothetical protein
MHGAGVNNAHRLAIPKRGWFSPGDRAAPVNQPMKRSPQAGFVLINMMGPVLTFAAVVAAVAWVIASRWDTFPVWVKIAIGVVGVGLVLAVIVMNVKESRENPNRGRGF